MINKGNFCHLHVHTEYSLLDGTINIKKLMAHLKDQGMDSCAITDHGNLFGAIEFYRLAKEAGIKPILGCEAYITLDKDDLENKDKNRDNFHLTLLAQNTQGWKNLIWLISNAYLHNFYYKPRVYIGHLKSHAEGVIALTGCLAGLASRAGTYDQTEFTFTDPEGQALGLLQWLKEIYGDNLYAEIQDNAMWEQGTYNKWLLTQAQKMKIPSVITTDAHYLKQLDHATHEVIMAQQLGQTLEEYKASKEMQYGTGYYIRSSEEMFDAAVRQGSEAAFWNTQKIAKLCNLEITLDKYQNPMFDITQCNDYQDFLRWKNGQK